MRESGTGHGAIAFARASRLPRSLCCRPLTPTLVHRSPQLYRVLERYSTISVASATRGLPNESFISLDASVGAENLDRLVTDVFGPATILPDEPRRSSEAPCKERRKEAYRSSLALRWRPWRRKGMGRRGKVRDRRRQQRRPLLVRCTTPIRVSSARSTASNARC